MMKSDDREPGTPRLVLDWTQFEQNVTSIREALDAAGLTWRPHVKSHGSGAIARYLMRRGAVGVTVATLDQAENMLGSGVGSVLLSAPLGRIQDLTAAAKLQSFGELIVTVDSPRHIDLIEQAGTRNVLPVIVEVDVGMSRTGTRSPEDAVAVAERAAAGRSTSFAGFMGYAGQVFRTWPREAKLEALNEAMSGLSRVLGLARTTGLEVPLVSGGGTGSLGLDRRDPLTESQTGGGVFMDATYRDDFHVPDLDYALYADCAVVAMHGDEVVLDAGFKFFGAARRDPQSQAGDMVIRPGSAHVSNATGGTQPCNIGDVVRLVPGYSDAALWGARRLYIELDSEIVESIPLHTASTVDLDLTGARESR